MILVSFSAHGTYIGQMRLEANKPTQLPIDSTFHFGASTRNYIIRYYYNRKYMIYINVDIDYETYGVPYVSVQQNNNSIIIEIHVEIL